MTVLAFVLIFAGFALIGRLTIISGNEVATVWPAAGVAVLWLLVRDAEILSTDTLLLAGASFLVNTLTGAGTWLAAMLALTTIVQTVAVIEAMRRALPGLWGCGGSRPMDSPSALARYLGCVAAGVLCGTAMGLVARRVSGLDGTWVDACLWMGRNAAGILIITTAGLFLLQYLSQPRPRPRLWDGARWEFLLACAVSGALYLLVFVVDVHSLLFLQLGVVTWFGVRFGTLTNAWHTLVFGHLAVAATLAGVGPFAHESPLENALLVQVFLIWIACTGLALSTGLDERRTLNAELRQSTREMTYQAQLLHAVVNSMAEGLAVVDDAGRWLLRNPAATRVGGLAGDLRGILAGAPGDRDPLALALAGETVRDMEVPVSDARGAGRILAVSAAPLPPDTVTGRARALLIFRDATVEHARRIDLTAFADVVAHDLRNPLAGIDSWTEMMAAELGDGDVEPDLIRRYIERVSTGTRRMKHLIDDLLHRATHDATLQLRRVDVGALVTEVARDHGANGHVRVGPIPEVHADPALVRQVIENLLGNALKFVAPGAAAKVEVSGRRTDSGTVAISVADEGIGLPAGSHDVVFEPQRRAHPTYDGRGLGLAICRRIVERHGGAITARDNHGGRGAVFEFTLPAPD